MFTFLFQFFFTIATVGLAVAAIRTYREDQHEKAARINDAYYLAQSYVRYRFENGWYYDENDEQIEKDFHKKYNELIVQ